MIIISYILLCCYMFVNFLKDGFSEDNNNIIFHMFHGEILLYISPQILRRVIFIIIYDCLYKNIMYQKKQFNFIKNYFQEETVIIFWGARDSPTHDRMKNIIMSSVNNK